MNFDFLEDMSNEDKDVEIQYHPDDEEEALKLKDFIEFQIQTLDVKDKYNQPLTIRYAMIYAIQCQDDKVYLHGRDHIYTCHLSWDEIFDMFHGIYFASIQKNALVNCYHIKEIDEQWTQIILKNNQVLTVKDAIELKQYEKNKIK